MRKKEVPAYASESSKLLLQYAETFRGSVLSSINTKYYTLLGFFLFQGWEQEGRLHP